MSSDKNFIILQDVSKRILDLSLEDPDMAEEFLDSFNEMLDSMLGRDQFGGEGQCDPRGDFRNGDFSVWEMED